MSKKYTIVANWKMYFSFNESFKYATDSLDRLIKLSNLPIEIVLCPSDPSLYPLIQIFKATKISFSAQNCSAHLNGAFTGQTSAQTLQELGCKYCLVGHSEIRKQHNETDDTIAHKFELLTAKGISPIVCIGESTEGGTETSLPILDAQLQKIIDLVNTKKSLLTNIPIFIAYEPVWSIGTGKIAEVDHLESIFAWLYNKTQMHFPSIHWNFLYGGSVNSKNIELLCKINYLSGFLIGKAGTNIEEFEKIVKKIYHL